MKSLILALVSFAFVTTGCSGNDNQTDKIQKNISEMNTINADLVPLKIFLIKDNSDNKDLAQFQASGLTDEQAKVARAKVQRFIFLGEKIERINKNVTVIDVAQLKNSMIRARQYQKMLGDSASEAVKAKSEDTKKTDAVKTGDDKTKAAAATKTEEVIDE